MRMGLKGVEVCGEWPAGVPLRGFRPRPRQSHQPPWVACRAAIARQPFAAMTSSPWYTTEELCTTRATEAEIHRANDNLKQAGQRSRFVAAKHLMHHPSPRRWAHPFGSGHLSCSQAPPHHSRFGLLPADLPKTCPAVHLRAVAHHRRHNCGVCGSRSPPAACCCRSASPRHGPDQRAGLRLAVHHSLELRAQLLSRARWVGGGGAASGQGSAP